MIIPALRGDLNRTFCRRCLHNKKEETRYVQASEARKGWRHRLRHYL